MINQKPFYTCCVCYEDYSWHARELRTYKDETWCEDCWDGTDMAHDQDILWGYLEKFVPEVDRKIDELEAEVERCTAATATRCADIVRTYKHFIVTDGGMWPTTPTREDFIAKIHKEFLEGSE